jgi:hypothetical protein
VVINKGTINKSMPTTAPTSRLYGGLSAPQSRLQASGFRLPMGNGYLLTDKGVGKQRNEDVVLVCPQQQLLAVIDGMGGHGDGHHAARFCANIISQPSTKPPSVEGVAEKLQLADQRLKNLGRKKIIAPDAGCCVSVLQALSVDEARQQIHLQVACIGDCKVLVLRPVQQQFGVLYDSDDLPGGLSYLLKQRFKSQIQQQFHAHHYFQHRHQVNQPLCAEPSLTPKLVMPPVLTLQNRDVILMMSDGIADNLASEEMVGILSRCAVQNAQNFAQAIFITVSQRQRHLWQRNATADRQLATQYGLAERGRHTGFINGMATATSPAWLQPAKLDNNALLCLQLSI